MAPRRREPVDGPAPIAFVHSKPADDMDRKQATRHIAATVEACRTDPEALLRAAFFAQGSINTNFGAFVNSLQDAWEAYKEGGTEAVNDEFGHVLHGWQKNAVRTVADRLDELHDLLDDPEALHDELCSIQGFGPAKAGFVVQIATGELCCLDRINSRRLQGITEHEILNLMPQRVNGPEEYREVCRRFDGRQLWADWCSIVGDRTGFSGGTEVSRFHVAFIRSGDTSGVR